MRLLDWRFLVVVPLLGLSALFYIIYYEVFGDTKYIFTNFLTNMAFLPVEVSIVTIIMRWLLGERDKRAMLRKLNMVIGAFFSEMGTDLLKELSAFDPQSEPLANELLVSDRWTHKEFLDVISRLKSYAYKTDSRLGDLVGLKDFLSARRTFLVTLLQNPNLLEHDTFTNLLWAVSHLSEELSCRTDVRQLSVADYGHLSVDISRAYGLLISEWLSYMKHLKITYPYLFSLAIRTNPFDPNACVEIPEAPGISH